MMPRSQNRAGSGGEEDRREKVGLPAYFPHRLRNVTKIRAIGRGEVLFRNGDPVEAVFLVLEGSLKAVRHLPSGTEIVMMRSGPGEFFAESAFASEQYSCDGVATHPGRVARIPVTALLAEMSEPAFARAFTLAIARHARRQCSRLERLRLRSAQDRIVHFVACEGNAEGVLEWPVTLKEMATELALEPETLYRALA